MSRAVRKAYVNRHGIAIHVGDVVQTFGRGEKGIVMRVLPPSRGYDTTYADVIYSKAGRVRGLAREYKRNPEHLGLLEAVGKAVVMRENIDHLTVRGAARRVPKVVINPEEDYGYNKIASRSGASAVFEGKRAVTRRQGIPNLDEMSADDLMDFWMKYQNRQKRADALALVGQRKGFTNVAKSLGAYAANKATALRCIEKGDEHAAAVYEKICESIYKGLPPDVRWRTR